MLDRTSQTLGNYRIISPLGHGGFADVYLGEHIYLKTQAAIKVLHAQLAPDMMEQFQAEARTIAHLDHPHIVRVRDFGIDNVTPYLVMDYAPNGTLRQRHLKGISLSLSLIVSYTKQIASALQYAHDQHTIHRDVKPENLLLGAKHQVLLSDFGIATISQTSRSLHTQHISGTIAYMAPEQVQGKARPASDQYSLAIIVYEWLTGRCPFQGSFAQIASQHLFAAPPGPSTLVPTISWELEEVLMTALSKNPDARFARVEAFANALEQASHSGLTPPTIAAGPFISPPDAPTFLMQPSAARQAMSGAPPVFVTELAQNASPPILTPPSTMPSAPSPAAASPDTGDQHRVKKEGVSRRALLLGMFGSAAVVGVGSVVLFWLTRGPSIANVIGSNTPVAKNTPSPNVSPSATATPQSDPTATSTPTSVAVAPLVHYGPGEHEYSVSWSPDSTRIASSGSGSIVEVWDSQHNGRYFTMNTQAVEVLRVAWSPDGSKIATSDSQGNVMIWDATNNGNLIRSIRAHPGHYANCLSWSPDNTKVVSGGGDKTACVWDVISGNNLVIYTGHTDHVNAVAWSHKGSFVVSGSDDFTAQVWDPNTGNQYLTYSRHTDKVLAVAWSPADTRIVSGSQDATAQIWDPTFGTFYFSYTGHRELVEAVDWSPDGQKIVTGSQDTTAQVWNAINGSHIYTFYGHSYEIEGVAWAPNSARVASASDDGTVQVWNVQ